jgi:hypothetical protein
MFFEQHFADVDPAIIARKSYIDKSVIGVVARYLDESSDCMNKNEAIAEITEFVTHYAMTLSRHRDVAPA